MIRRAERGSPLEGAAHSLRSLRVRFGDCIASASNPVRSFTRTHHEAPRN
jgi:hypothetical protein